MIFEKLVVGGYKGSMFTRCDDRETVFYFSAKDFPGLKAEPFSFVSSLGHTLQGYFYYYDNPIQDKLVVFDHGFGGGHQAYMKEINTLCRRGYKVFSYDHTGCMQSGGQSPNGLAQSLCDLNDCLSALKKEASLAGTKFSVMGHSWGAFSTLNIAALHPDVTHVVAISGFVSVPEMVNTFFSGIMKGYRKAVLDLERNANPIFVNYNAIESLSQSNVNALLIYSANDPLCKKYHYDLLKEGLDGKENVKFLLLPSKGHNPNYTEDAVAYLGQFSKARAKLLRQKNVTPQEKADFVASFDWNKMTVQDDNVWKTIFQHLDND